MGTPLNDLARQIEAGRLCVHRFFEGNAVSNLIFLRSMTHALLSDALARGCQLFSQAQPPLGHLPNR